MTSLELPSDIDLKREFAELIFRDPLRNGYAAAFTLKQKYGLPWQNGFCMEVNETWQRDPDIRSALTAIRTERGEIGEGWTRQEFLEELRRTALKASQDKDKISAMNLYADVTGFKQKDAGPQVNVNVGIQNNVMKVPAELTEDEWELKAVGQQSKLIEHATS